MNTLSPDHAQAETTECPIAEKRASRRDNTSPCESDTQTTSGVSTFPEYEPRRRWMAILARAGAEEIAARLQACAPRASWRVLRGPESGLVMMRGRAGGGGAPFNVGEATVTRCTVRTDAGHIGHAYVLGRDDRQAELAAAVDGLLQDPSMHDVVLSAVIAPLAEGQAERRRTVAAKAAATRVQFFAMRTMRA